MLAPASLFFSGGVPMQTFLPISGYAASASVLDNRRLGKQRVECKQILRALGVQVGSVSVISAGWRRHPAVLMWKGHEYSLCVYAMRVCDEWIRRGYRDTLLDQFRDASTQLWNDCRSLDLPNWFGDHDFHASHRSNLLRKDPKWYGQFGWTETDDLPYVWPTKGMVNS